MHKLASVLAMSLAIGAVSPSLAAGGQKAAATQTSAAYSVADTPLGTLLDDPVSKEIIRKYAPAVLENPRVGLARPLTLAQLQRFGGDTLNDDVLAKIDAALKAAAPK